MRQSLFLIVAVLATMLGFAQVPQFSSTEYEGWIYNNPSITLDESSIVNNKIALYVVSNGLVLSLTSPEFSCSRGETIDMEVQWITPQWQNEGFRPDWVALTAALLDETDQTVDSVTYVPVSVSKTNNWKMSMVVSRTLQNARLRFVAWKSIVSNCGMVRRIKATAANRADVNLDGEVTVADVNAIIKVILCVEDSLEMQLRADVNEDGEVNIADVNTVIEIILN